MFSSSGDGDVPDTLRTDLLVIGSGPAGIALANEFLGSDVSVLVAESGAVRRSPADRLNEIDSIGIEYVGGTLGRSRMFGGTGQKWVGQCLRLDPLDFEPRDWIPGSGWPIGYDDLEPFYERADQLFHVAGETYDGSILGDVYEEVPQFREDILVSRNTVFSPSRKLGSVFRSTFKHSRNVRVLFDATVVRVLSNSSGDRVTGAEIRSLRGRVLRVECEAVVLCCGAIENARLLLSSGTDGAPGIGNDYGWVGRSYQDHPYSTPAEVIGASDLLQEWYQSVFRGKVQYLPKTALSPEFQRQRRVLNAVVGLRFERDNDSSFGAAYRLFQAVREGERPSASDGLQLLSHPRAIGQLLRWRFGGGSTMLERPTRVLVGVITEQPPECDSYVGLSDRRDALGAQLPQIHWNVGELEWRTERATVEAVASEFARCGLGDVRPFPWLESYREWRQHQVDQYHHAGTTRMSTVPALGVVDVNCQVHEVIGLYVAGGSVFPTSGYANPTLTIVALALRLAHHLAGR